MNALPDHIGLPHEPEAEGSVLGGILLRPELLDDLQTLEVEAFFDARNRVVFSAMRNLVSDGRPIDVVLLEAEIQRRGNIDAIGGVAYLGELSLRVPTADNVLEYAKLIERAWRNRRVQLELAEAAARVRRGSYDPDDVLDETIGELQRLQEGAKRPSRRRDPWLRGSEIAAEIHRNAGKPWVSFMIGTDELCRVRVGGIVTVMGGSGSGKSSLVAGALIQHARHTGPAIILSRELPADEFGGRAAGMQCDASWEDVLRGRLRAEFVDDALDLPRLFVLEREHATFVQLERCIAAAKASYPNEPMIVAADYVQILESSQREVRMQVAEILDRFDRLLRREDCAGIAISQMSRANADSVRDGDKLGAQTASGGAESAAIERFSTLTITIGTKSEKREDGTELVDINVGKGRMGGGDRVVPATFWGHSGRFRITGEARTPAEIRVERSTRKDDQYQQSLEFALVGAASKATAPMSRNDLAGMVKGRRGDKLSSVDTLIGRGELVEVAHRSPRSAKWMICSPAIATKLGMTLIKTNE